MKILLICRFMNGFVESVRRRSWQPSGAPAIARLIEHLDREEDGLTIVLTRSFASREEERALAGLAGKSIAIAGLRTPVSVMMAPARGGKRLGYYTREWAHIRRLRRLVRELAPDIIYADRSNILPAACLARYSGVPVLLRLLGVPPDLKTILHGHHPARVLFRWAYRAPFAHVLCTSEGSGGAAWMDRALRPDVPRSLWFNGVDVARASGPLPAAIAKLPRDRMIVTLLGRLEALKGADLFVEALLALPEAAARRVHGLIVGDGSLLPALRRRVEAAGAGERVTFTGAIPHDQVPHALAATDVYVSLNRQGALSNATLEAAARKTCLVLMHPSAGEGGGGEGGAEEELARLLPRGSHIAVPPNVSAAALADRLARLSAEPQTRERLRASLAAAIEGKLIGWQARIAREVALLRAIGEGSNGEAHGLAMARAVSQGGRS